MNRFLVAAVVAVLFWLGAGCGQKNPASHTPSVQWFEVNWGSRAGDPIKIAFKFDDTSRPATKPLSGDIPDSMYVRVYTRLGGAIENIVLNVYPEERIAFGTSTRDYSDGAYRAVGFAIFRAPSLVTIPSDTVNFNVSGGQADVRVAWGVATTPSIDVIAEFPPSQTTIRVRPGTGNPTAAFLGAGVSKFVFLEVLATSTGDPQTSVWYVRKTGTAPRAFFRGDSLFVWDSQDSLLAANIMATHIINGVPTDSIAALNLNLQFSPANNLRVLRFGGYLAADPADFVAYSGQTLGLALWHIDHNAGELIGLDTPLSSALQTVFGQ